MVRLGRGLTNSLDISKKSPNKTKKVRFATTDITNQDFRKFLNDFKNSPYLGYKNK